MCTHHGSQQVTWPNMPHTSQLFTRLISRITSISHFSFSLHCIHSLPKRPGYSPASCKLLVCVPPALFMQWVRLRHLPKNKTSPEPPAEVACEAFCEVLPQFCPEATHVPSALLKTSCSFPLPRFSQQTRAVQRTTGRVSGFFFPLHKFVYSLRKSKEEEE